jgi:hypothetical protein
MKLAKINSNRQAVPVIDRSTTQLARLRRLAVNTLQSVPLEPPALDPNFSRLAALERAGEVLRYHARRTEHWLSPGGHVRAWLRLNIRLALVLGIPTVLLTPIVTLILTTAVTWSARLAEIARNLAIIPGWLGTGLIGLTTILFLLRLFFGR